MRCLACNFEADGKKLSNHIRKEHGLKSIDYVIRYIHDGVRPGCVICGEETRYSAWKFKKYCKAHRKEAEHAGGKEGGKAKAWNKGLTKETDERLRLHSERVSGEGNHFYGKTHSEETIAKISSVKKVQWEDYLSPHFDILTPYEEYGHKWHYLDVKCKECGDETKRTFQTLERGSRCNICHPMTSSKAEDEIAEFISSVYSGKIERGTRHVITPLELDIYLPELNLAIEHHGLYWHAERPKLHRKKFDACRDIGVRLIQFFSDDWLDRQEICKSMLLSRMGFAEKLDARKCELREVHHNDAWRFFDATHIDGFVRARKTFGLYFDEELVSAMSMRRPFHKKYLGMMEIARFSSRLNTVVRGGLSRLLKRCIKEADTNVMTYADLRFGLGEGYSKCGMRLVSDTKTSFWWSDDRHRFGRFSFRAGGGMTEAEVAANAGVRKIYGPGSNVYLHFR